MVSIGRVGGGVIEGGYTSWVWKWTEIPSDGINTLDELTVLIDEKSEVLSIAYADNNNKARFAIYNISDFSAVFEAPSGAYYLPTGPYSTYKASIGQGYVYFPYGGLSQSIQSYLLLKRDDSFTIEVWRGGTSALWTRDVSLDFPGAACCDGGAISATGKYVLVAIRDAASPYLRRIILYEGA